MFRFVWIVDLLNSENKSLILFCFEIINRNLRKNSNSVYPCILHKISWFVHELCFVLQYNHEGKIEVQFKCLNISFNTNPLCFLKLFFVTSSAATVYLIYHKFKVTYDKNHDSFRIEYLIGPCAVLSLLIRHEFTVMEVLWTFSIYLEAVAILPQLFMVSKTGEAETITSHYLFALGSYRALYILNWIWRYYAESFVDWIAIVAGLVQTVLYCDFFYLYVTRVLNGRKLRLPA